MIRSFLPMPMWFDSTTPTKFLLTVTNYLIIANYAKRRTSCNGL